MNDETKVGLFVVVGLALLGTAIFLLGDFSIYRRYPLYVEFKDVAGLPDKSLVKLSGVEIGKVRRVSIKNSGALVELAIASGIKIYKNSRFLVGSTSIIGSKFMQIDQGTPGSGVIEEGALVSGDEAMPLDRSLAKALTSIQQLLDDVGDKGRLSENLNSTMANLREITANMNDLIGDSQPHLHRAMAKLDSITDKLDSLLAKTDSLVSKINTGEGAVGALVSDPKVKDDVTSALSNFKDASASAKDVLGRINSFRVFWLYNNRYEPLARTSRSDVGIRIYPREGRYYHLGASNIANPSDLPRGPDYERRNTIDAQLGWETKGLDFYAGLIRGAGGVGIRYRPFYESGIWDRFVILAESFDFLRNRVVEGRTFSSPEYDIGAEIRLNRIFSVGARINDLRETKRAQYTARINFEDKDIAYLLGLITFSSAGVKGRSSSQ